MNIEKNIPEKKLPEEIQSIFFEEAESEETHIEMEIKETIENESLEDRFVKSKWIFLTKKLSRIQEMIDFEVVNQNVGFLLTILFILHFIEKEVGLKYINRILDRLSSTGLQLNLFLPALKQVNFEDRIKHLIQIYTKNYGGRELSQTDLTESVLKAWNDFDLHKNWNEEEKRLIEHTKKLYRLIGSKPDKERRELIETLASKGGRKVPLKLHNIGIVPTEICPNYCRFCLTPWKSSLEERIGRNWDEKEVQKNFDQIIEFAADKNLTLTITGGEPFLEVERVLYIIRNAKTPVEVSTSGMWAKDLIEAEDILSKIESEIKRREIKAHDKFDFVLQVSLDAFHQEIKLQSDGSLKENVPLSAIINIIELTQSKFTNIKVCLLTKYTSYPDPLARLLLELRKKGWNWIFVRKYYDSRLKVPIMNRENKIVMKTALQKAFLTLNRMIPMGAFKGKPIFVLYGQIENIGRATLLESFEFPIHQARRDDFIWDEDSREQFPLSGLEVSDDWSVYPEAYSLFSWSLGNIQEINLWEIYRIAEYDPLFIAMAEAPVKIKNFALEIEPKIMKEFKSASSPMAIVYKILENPWMRLYITKRLIIEDPSYSNELRKELGLNISLEKLKEEYFNQKISSEVSEF